jgi:hypothetical protein
LNEVNISVWSTPAPEISVQSTPAPLIAVQSTPAPAISVTSTPAPIIEVGEVVEVPSQNTALTFVYNETPAGVRNNSNATFTTLFHFVPESVQLHVNGLLQKPVQDYQTTGTNTLLLTESPGPTETILISYLKT